MKLPAAGDASAAAAGSRPSLAYSPSAFRAALTGSPSG